MSILASACAVCTQCKHLAFAHFNPHGSEFGNICALYSPFLHQLTMQSSLFELGRPVIFTCSTGDCVDATVKGPSGKGDQFAVLECRKGGQMVTHPCAPLPRIEFRHLQVVSMCNCSAWCMIARRISGLCIVHCLCQHGCEPEIFMFPRLSCVCMHLEMWAEVKVHSYHAHAHVCASSCMCCKLRLCPSYNGHRDRNNSVHWSSLYRGGGVLPTERLLWSFLGHLVCFMCRRAYKLS